MSVLNRISIRSKIILIIFFSNIIIIGIGISLEIYFTKISLKNRYSQDISHHTKRIGQQCITPLDFNFPKDAEERLETLSSIKEIKHAYVYNEKNELFAKYHFDSIITKTPNFENIKQEIVYIDDTLIIKKKIIYNNEIVGHIITISNTEISKQLDKRYLILILASLILIIIAFFLASYMQKFISKPILVLSEVVSEISEKKDYSLKINNPYFDEIGVLNSKINNFLQIIQNREIERDAAENALRQSEERFRSLAELLPETVFEVNSKLEFSFINKSAINTFEYSQEEIKNLNFKEIIIKEDFPKLKETIKELMKSKKAISSEYNAIKKNGEIFPALLYVSPVYIKKALNGFRGILIDFSELKEAQNKIEQLNRTLEQKVIERTKKLKKANEELAEVSYISAHDFKTPIRGITQLATWILEDYDKTLNSDLKESIKLLLSRANHMNNLVNGILEYMSLGHTKTNEGNFTFAEIFEIIKTKQPTKNVHFTIQGDEIELNFNKEHLILLFYHLIENSIKFNTNQLVKISINISESKNSIIFSIKDNGIGIDSKYHEKIFGIFKTLSSNYETKNVGIGLALVKKIVDLYDGKIKIESEKNTGTRISIYINKLNDQHE